MSETEDDKEDTVKQFDDADYKGVVFVQKDILCNLEVKAGIPASWMQPSFHCGHFLQLKNSV